MVADFLQSCGKSDFAAVNVNSQKAEPLKTRSFAVIGIGTFGSTVASELTRLGNPVFGVDVEGRYVTGDFDTAGGVVITAIMFVGRVGPLTFGFLLATRKPKWISYPSGTVYLG